MEFLCLERGLVKIFWLIEYKKEKPTTAPFQGHQRHTLCGSPLLYPIYPKGYTILLPGISLSNERWSNFLLHTIGKESVQALAEKKNLPQPDGQEKEWQHPIYTIQPKGYFHP